MFPSSHRLLMTGGEQMSEIGLKNQGVSMGSEVEGWEWKKGKKKCRRGCCKMYCLILYPKRAGNRAEFCIIS